MKTRILAVLIVLLLALLVVVLPSVNLQRIHAEWRIERWAARLIEQGGTGRNCASSNYLDANRVLASLGREQIEADDPRRMLWQDYPVSCMSDMKLETMTHYVRHNAVSGVYRCEKDGVVEELQLTVRLEPRAVPQEDDCKRAVFPFEWALPVGAVTMFGLP